MILRYKHNNQLEYGGECFELFCDRQRGARLYTNTDRSKYLRIGDYNIIEKELSFHHKLVEFGFPVAKIIDEGKLENSYFWIEESIGREHFTDIFRKDCESLGYISNHSFNVFISIMKAVYDAQERSLQVEPYNFVILANAVGFDGILAELPDARSKLQDAWKRVEEELLGHPQCLTHGDLTSHNILSGGIIDFGDHFSGPVGYDMVNTITTPFWFPKDRAYELYRLYSFTNDQIKKYFSIVGMYQTLNSRLDIIEKFDTLFFLRATWWAVRNYRCPKLQSWRYEKYLTLVDYYIHNKSLFDFWRAHKDD